LSGSRESRLRSTKREKKNELKRDESSQGVERFKTPNYMQGENCFKKDNTARLPPGMLGTISKKET